MMLRVSGESPSMRYNGNKKKPLRYGIPPWHSVVLVCLMVSAFVALLPSDEEMTSTATVERFTNVLFPQLIPSLWYLFILRSLVAITIWATSCYLVFISDGWSQTPSYHKNSKLIVHEIRLRGIKTMIPFTSLSWNMLGLSFSLNAYITYSVVQGTSEDLDPRLLRFAMLLWECAAPFTLLVAAVIRYAIWPKVLAVGGDSTNLKQWRNKLMHNINVWFAVGETALVSGLAPHPSHFSVAPLIGCFYIIFSWMIANTWTPPESGPQCKFVVLPVGLLVVEKYWLHAAAHEN